MQVECILNQDLSPRDAREIALIWRAIWPADVLDVEKKAREIIQRGNEYAGPEGQAPRFFLVRDGGVICATSHIFPRLISTSMGEMTVMALVGVAVSSEYRGSGFGRATVERAFAIVSQGVFQWSLFQTGEGARVFYEKLGARVVANRFVNSKSDDPSANPWWEPLVMVYPSAPGWPDGQIDLNGPGY